MIISQSDIEKLRHAEDLINSIVNCGEKPSNESRQVFKKAATILRKLIYTRAGGSMKAIIIEEERFIEILETLKYEVEKMISEGSSSSYQKGIREAHRNFHHHLVKWMQSHGASIIRK